LLPAKNRQKPRQKTCAFAAVVARFDGDGDSRRFCLLVETKMKTGEKLDYAAVCERIRVAVASIVDDAADTAKLHNLVAQGKIMLDETDPMRETYICTEGDGTDDPPGPSRDVPPYR
jgi:hypothetical protein